MRQNLMVAGLVVAMAAPSIAGARTYCEQRAHDKRVTGTLIGAGVGALLGQAVTHDTGGTLIGGVGGAVVGNQISRRKCTTYRSASRTRYRPAPVASTGYYSNASYAGRCRYETRPYYNERGELIYAPTQVCR